MVAGLAMYSFSFIFLSYFWQRFALYTALFVCVCVCVVCVCVWCVYVCVENFPEFCQCSAIASLSFPPPPWGPCVVLGAPAAAPGQLDSQFSSTADVVVALPATLAVCCSPTGRTTTAPSPQLEGNQIQFMAERAREFILVVVVVRLLCCCC